jgi:hypothetical protein
MASHFKLKIFRALDQNRLIELSSNEGLLNLVLNQISQYSSSFKILEKYMCVSVLAVKPTKKEIDELLLTMESLENSIHPGIASFFSNLQK